MSIHQTIEISASPEKVYRALLSSAEFGQVTGAAANIAPDVGGEFICFDGQVTGRHVELVPNERIVQAWRVGPWPDGIYSIVKFDISGAGESSTLELHHSGFPDGAEDHLEGGWHKMYWDPLKAHFA